MARDVNHQSRGDIWFDPWLVPTSHALKALAVDLEAVLLANERRIRGRRESAVVAFRATVAAIVANLAKASLEASEGQSIAVPLGRPQGPGMDRYGHPLVSGRAFVGVLKAMEREGWIIITPGKIGRTSTIVATPMFFADIMQRGMTSDDDIGRDDDSEEVIILSRKRRAWTESGPSASTEYIGYSDTPKLNRMRDEVRKLNTHMMARLDLGFIPDGEVPIVDIKQRRVRRHFSLLPGQPQVSPEAFSQGGRLFGAFWINLSRERRRASLRIDGEPIAEVDFQGLFPRLALAVVHSQSSATSEIDPYAIHGFPKDHRSGLKKIFNALLFADGDLKRLPADVAGEMPRGWSLKKVKEAILQTQPALIKAFGERLGFGFMFTESEILLGSLERLHGAGIAALPLHDAVLVPRSKADAAKVIMEEVAEGVTGLRLPIGVKL